MTLVLDFLRSEHAEVQEITSSKQPKPFASEPREPNIPELRNMSVNPEPHGLQPPPKPQNTNALTPKTSINLFYSKNKAYTKPNSTLETLIKNTI